MAMEIITYNHSGSFSFRLEFLSEHVIKSQFNIYSYSLDTTCLPWLYIIHYRWPC